MPSSRSTPEERFGKIIVTVWKQVRRKREEDECAYLMQNFESKVDSVFNRYMPNKPSRARQIVLPKTTDDSSSTSNKKGPKVQRIPLVGALEPVPPHTGRLHMTKSYPVEDNRELSFVPSAFADANADEAENKSSGSNDDNNNDGTTNERRSTTPMEDYFALFDVAARERAIIDGPLHHVEEMDNDISETMRQSLNHKLYRDEIEGTINHEQVAHYLVTNLARLADVDEARAQNLYEIVKTASGSGEEKGSPSASVGAAGSKSGDSLGESVQSSSPKDGIKCIPQSPGSPPTRRKLLEGRNSDDRSSRKKRKRSNSDLIFSPFSPSAGPFCIPATEDDPEYLKLVDSYRKLYCKRCKMYDCVVHGLREKPSLQLSYELGITAERDRRARSRGDSSSPVPPQTELSEQPDNSNISEARQSKEIGTTAAVPVPAAATTTKTELTAFHKIICRRFFLIFEGDVDQMAVAMGANPGRLKEFVDRQNWTQPELRLVPPIKPETNPYHSLRNYNQHWYSRIIKSGLRPSFEPCVHDEPCRETICDCVDRSIFCTDACAWGSRSKNFFRGCDCRSSCTTSSCSCFANSRECNPDICKCDTCTDPPNRPATMQRCRNDNLTMCRDTEIAIAVSKVPNAGCGAFTKRFLHKGEFLGEYVGEMISQEEADRRGQLYDIRNHSSLFMLTADVALDAERKGNLMRYINHSATPNTTPRTVTVNGDNRIGFYALQDIEAQTELTFNYGYNFSVNNDFVLKAAKAVPWMEAPSNQQPGYSNGNNNNGMKKVQSKRKPKYSTSSDDGVKAQKGKRPASSTTGERSNILGDIDATRDMGGKRKRWE